MLDRKPSNILLDPATPTQITISVGEIAVYDKNPRRAENKATAELKATIAEQGIDALMFPVTRRPGEKHYIPNSGGNTRLKILKELYQSTRDEKYLWLKTTFIPFVNESTLLVNHLAENSDRDGNIFIDISVGIREALKAHYAENPDEPQSMTQREIITFLKSRGLQVHLSVLGVHNYAIDDLYEHIPIALDSGMGRPRVIELKAIDTKYRNYWLAQGLLETEFQAHWVSTLATNDSWDSFSAQQVKSDLLNIVAERVCQHHPEYPGVLSVEAIESEVKHHANGTLALVPSLSKDKNYGWDDAPDWEAFSDGK